MTDMNNNIIAEELMNELELLRSKMNRMKEVRKISIEKKKEKYQAYYKEYQKEYYHSRQKNNEEYMAYQRKRALERYYIKKAEKLALVENNENILVEN